MRLALLLRVAFAAAALSTAGLALAAASNVSKSGFLVTHHSEVKADPAAVYAAIVQVGKWWSPAHTYSGDAANLSMDPRVGGCFCETWGKNAALHARVIQAQRDKMLRLEGSLGPLQEMAVLGIMTFAIAQESGKTALTLTYRVRAPDAALDKLAPVVDKVIGEQFQRLIAFAGGVPLSGESLAPGPADQYFDSNGVRIRYVEDGKGDPVILVHGYTNRIEDQWITTGVLPALARRFRVIAFDARGHGKSDKPHDPRQYGAEMGLDVIRLMDHLGIGRAHIIGYSMGAHIIAQLVTTHPERFITMTLGGATGRRNWTAEDDRRAEAEAAEMDEGSLRSQILRLAPAGQPRPTEEEIRKRSAERLAGQDPKALAAVRRSNRDQVVTVEQMAAVKVPTLGVVGNNDPYIGDFVRLKAVMPSLVRMVAIGDATHATAPSAPEFVVAIQDFLNNHRAAIANQ
jgi:pimeloyl-ACP methyl ester carboxylesterase